MSTTIQTDNIAGQDYSSYGWDNNESGQAGDAGEVEAAIDDQVVSDTYSELVDAANSGVLDGFISEFEGQDADASFAGESFNDGNQLTQIAKKAELLSSDEIQALADDGRITQKQADYLKVLGGVAATLESEKGSGLSAYDYSRVYDSMVNFANQDSSSQSATVSAFSDRQVERNYSWDYDADTDSVNVSNVWAEHAEPTDAASAATSSLGSERNWDDLINSDAIERLDKVFDEATLGPQYATSYEQYARTLYKEVGQDGLDAAVADGKMSQGTADFITAHAQYYEATGRKNDQGIAYMMAGMNDTDRQFVVDQLAAGGDAKAGMVDFLSKTLTELNNAGGVPSNMSADRLRWYIDDGRNSIADTIESGGTANDSQMQAFMDNVVGISPDEIQAQVPDSLTQDEANWLITATGVAATNPTPEEFSTAMKNFNAASDWAQDSITDAFRGRTVETGSIFANCEGNDFSTATLAPTQTLSSLAQSASELLKGATTDTVDELPDALGNAQVDDAFWLGDDDQISREDMEARASQSIEGFDSLSDATKDLIVDNLMLLDDPDVNLNDQSYVIQPELDDDGNPVYDENGLQVFDVKSAYLTPYDIRSRDVAEGEAAGKSYMEITTGVLTESLSDKQDQINDITDQIDDNNDTFTNCNNSVSALQSASTSSDGVDDEYYDISKLTMTDASGATDTTILDFCDAYDIDIPEGVGQYGTKLTDDQVQTLMDNIDRKKSSIERITDDLTTQVQTLTSQYQVILQLITGLIQAWKEEGEGVTRNIS